MPVSPTRTQLAMALTGLGSARLDTPFRTGFSDEAIARAMAGLSLNTGISKLMAEELEKRGAEFRDDGWVRVPEKE